MSEPSTPGGSPGVELADVTVRFGDLTALADVDLTVERGEFFTLVGPSGCGKTTTLRTVAGFETPDVGTVRLAGRDVTGVPPEERSVGIVFQSYALFPHMSVRENVAYPLRFRDPPGGVGVDERVTELLALVDMADTGDRDPATLSGGQQQRIALARALAPGPDVLLLDEPLSALDARLRERLRLTVREVQRELGTTTVYVTHDQAEALAVSDRVAVVRDGRIEQVGPPETVYREPATRFVAEFLGDTALLEGTVTGDRVRVGSGATAATLPLPAGERRPDGASVTLSVRPEAFVVRPRDPDGDARAVEGGDEAAGTDAAGDTDTDADGDGTGTGTGAGSQPLPRALPATVETTEFTGGAYRVHCAWGDRALLATTRGTSAPAGAVWLDADPDAVHLLE